MKNLILCLLAGTLLCSILSCTTQSIGENAENFNTNFVTPETKVIEIEILELLNNYRQTEGLLPLKKLAIIKSQAYLHTDYMIETNNLSHDNFSQRRAYLRQNTDANKVSENVAYAYNSPISVVNAWLNSDSHRAAIIGDYTHFDISAEQDENDDWYFTNIFVKK